MKAFILSLLFPATVPLAHMSDQPLPSIPNALACKGMMRIYGEPAFTNLSYYGEIKLTQLNTEPAWNEKIGEIRHELHDDKVTIDFSDGDQYSSFTFRKDDLGALHRGDIKLLSGVYEDGYDWADGSHTRAAILVHCKSE